MPPSAAEDGPAPSRWTGIDIARGVALVAMAVFHLGWDLSLFNLLSFDLAAEPGWRGFARVIAGSFLILVGISQTLAHGRGVRWRPFLRRLAVVAGAAAAVTVATWFVFPDTFIYFGILHAIAVSSVLALPFLNAPPALALAGALACLLAPTLLRSPAFDGPALYWLGLGTAIRPTNDYEPILPWFGFVLAGIAAARLVLPRLPALPASVRESRPARLLAFAGRHSLAFYLLHQPILIGCVWLAAQAIGPVPASDSAFIPACEANCRSVGQEAGLCVATCRCSAERLKQASLFDQAARNRPSQEERRAVTALVQQCLREMEEPR